MVFCSTIDQAFKKYEIYQHYVKLALKAARRYAWGLGSVQRMFRYKL